MKFLTIFLFINLYAFNLLNAQIMSGIHASNYSGTNKLIINPSSLALIDHCMEINLASFNMGFQNDYFYIPSQYIDYRSFRQLEYPMYQNEGEYAFERDNKNHLNVFQNLRLNGPSLAFRHSNHSFALVNNTRILTSGKGIPGQMVTIVREGINDIPITETQFEQSRPIKIASISLAELGLNYSIALKNSSGERWSIGATFKRVWSSHAINLDSENGQFHFTNERDIQIDNLSLIATAMTPFEYENKSVFYSGSLINATGFSLDLGFTIEKKDNESSAPVSLQRRSQKPKHEYKWKLGVSLIDLGRIHIAPKFYEITTENSSWNREYTYDFIEYQNIDEILDELENIHADGSFNYGNPRSGFFLPTGISTQFDHKISENIFLYSYWIQDLPIARRRIARPSLIGTVLRYETQWFEIAMPATLFEYHKPRLGISVRIGPLTIGTDQIGGLAKTNDFDGFDFYFSINHSIKSCEKQRKRKDENFCRNYWH